MIQHVVMFRWREGVDDAHVAAASAALATLPGLIPQIVSFRYGADLRTVPNNFDFAVSAQFASLEDYLIYRDHPDHQALVQTYMVPFIVERAAVQFAEG
jgi:hypothetical protein